MLLYGYGLVCLSMLVFNILYNATLKGRERQLAKKSRHLAGRVDFQLWRLRGGDGLERRHLTYLRRKLSRVEGLISFDRTMDGLQETEPKEIVEAYYRQIQPVILYLAVLYRERDDMQAAYFAYFLSRHKLKRHLAVDAVQDIMVEYMTKKSVYCRANALQALYAFGSAERVAEAVTALDRSGLFFHDKILTDGLLSFTGSHSRLTELLMARFDAFSVQARLAVLNYIRFRTGEYCPWMLEILMDPGQDKELCLSAIRYFGRYPYDGAKPALLAFAGEKDPLRWEYAAVSASALAGYPGEEVIDVLIAAIYSSNWFVRSNAAASLEAHGLDYGDLSGVVGGGDRYVREMMLYQLDLRRVRQEEREAVV